MCNGCEKWCRPESEEECKACGGSLKVLRANKVAPDGSPVPETKKARQRRKKQVAFEGRHIPSGLRPSFVK